MTELIFYIAIGMCAGVAQFVVDDNDWHKIPIIVICWPIVILVCLFVGLLRWADQ